MRKGFTLLEMLAAISVFIILALLVTRLVSGTSMAIIAANKSMDADSQARFVFSRMALDFSRMVKRNDVDMIFSKQTGNDKMFFYSEVAAAFDSNILSGNNDPRNSVSLVGYRIQPDVQNNLILQLERLGKGLTWDENTSDSGGGVVFLTYQSGTAIVESTLDGHIWHSSDGGSYSPPLIGSAPNYQGPPSNQANDYHVIGDQIFRFEFCFLLNDGTYSNKTVKDLSQLPTPQNQQVVCNLTATSPPTANDIKISGQNVAAGSRWFDTNAGRGYVCQSLTVTTTGTQAVWASAGVQDVSAIVVAIAILDQTSRKIVTDMTSLPNLFDDPTDNDLAGGNTNNPQPNQAVLMEQKWKTAMASPSFAQNAQIPMAAAGQIKVYQRYFYINNSQ